MQERALKTRIFCDPRQGREGQKKKTQKKIGSENILRPKLNWRIILDMIGLFVENPRHQLPLIRTNTSYQGQVLKQIEIAGLEFLRKAVASFCAVAILKRAQGPL